MNGNVLKISFLSKNLYETLWGRSLRSETMTYCQHFHIVIDHHGWPYERTATRPFLWCYYFLAFLVVWEIFPTPNNAYISCRSCSLCMYVGMYVCTYVGTYVCTYACVHVCTYACMFVCFFPFTIPFNLLLSNGRSRTLSRPIKNYW